MDVRVGDWVRVVERFGDYKDEWYGLVYRSDNPALSGYVSVLRLNGPGSGRTLPTNTVVEVRRASQSD